MPPSVQAGDDDASDATAPVAGGPDDSRTDDSAAGVGGTGADDEGAGAETRVGPGAVQERLAAAAARSRQLSTDMAATARTSAEVHDQAARVHDQLPAHLSRQDPQDLRDHAERERTFAAAEDEAAEEG